MGAICAHAEHLARDFLPSAIRPIYYLGIEEADGVNAFILHVAQTKATCLNTQTNAGQQFLGRMAEDHTLLVEAFREMYDKEDNDWRNESADVPSTPPILMG